MVASGVRTAEVKASGGSIQIDAVEGEVLARTSGVDMRMGKLR
jgi:hypothetical protein